jgi:hypothetical protein
MPIGNVSTRGWMFFKQYGYLLLTQAKSDGTKIDMGY